MKEQSKNNLNENFSRILREQGLFPRLHATSIRKSLRCRWHAHSQHAEQDQSYCAHRDLDKRG